MDGDYFKRGFDNIEELEANYRRMAMLHEPCGPNSDPANTRAYFQALRGIERCILMRIRLLREARMCPQPRRELELEEPVGVDLTLLSDGALEEVQAALTEVRTRLGRKRYNKRGAMVAKTEVGRSVSSENREKRPLSG